MEEFKFPTESVELPSKGLVYPKDNPLSSGKVEMKYMTAKEEDILTNQNYIKDFQPDIDLKFNHESSDGIVEELTLPMTVNFFWPDSDL